MALDKVKIGYVLGGLSLTVLVGACVKLGDPPTAWLNMLLLVFGGLLGWVTGILATPLDPKEKSQFSTYAAAISTFLSGFLVAKLDKIFEATFAQRGFTEVDFGRALIFGSAFLLGALFTFVGRKYLP